MLHQVKSLIGHHHPLRLLWHKAKAFAAALRYGFPAKKLTVIGITGTDGKTTTVGMVSHILQQNGKKTGALSTAFFDIDGVRTWNATQKTSPSPFAIQSFLRRIVHAGCTHAVIEYSSHGLVQGRTLFTWPHVAAITNISAEHLDYHGTMEQYIADKGLLFRMLKSNGTKVLNADDRTYQIYQEIPSDRTISTSMTQSFGAPANENECSLWATDIRPGKETTAAIHCDAEDGVHTLALKIPGDFNVNNALTAIGCAHAVGISIADSVNALQSFTGIPGRMELIDEGQPFLVYVDFTVTPASYERTLTTLKKMLQPGNRLLVLMGSCGDRMKEKRPEIGRIASGLANVIIVTNEDPYTEDPEKIIDEVWAGIDQSKTEAHRTSDRKQAIEQIFALAKPGDIVILCGKGSDTTMWVSEGQIPWNEREIAREVLQKKGG